MRKFMLVAGLLLAYIPNAVAQERINTRCTRDRCVLYDRQGRVGTVEHDDTGRTVLRDNSYRVRAKVTETGNGTFRIDRPGRRR